MLGQSAAPLVSLTEGDRLFVPVIGATLAVAGQVKRPGIFELPPGQSGIDAADLLRLGGGELVRGEYRHSVLRIGKDGGQDLVVLPKPAGRQVHGGEILLIDPAAAATSGRVSLLGHVRQPGPQPLSTARTARALVGGYGGLLPDPYLPFAVVQQTDPRSRATSFRKIDLRSVLEGRSNQSLASDDRIYVFGLNDVRFLTSFDVVEALSGQLTPNSRNCAGIQFLARWIRSNPRSEVAAGQFSSAVRDLAGGPQPCPELFNDVPGLLTFLLQNAILVRGNVLYPGIYPVASRDSVDEVMGIARSLNVERRGDATPPPDAPPVTVVEDDLGKAFDIGASDTSLITRMSQSARPLPGANPWALDGSRPPAGDTAFPAWTILEVEEPRVTLTGHVRYPGTRSLGASTTLRDLVGDTAIYQDDPYLLFGIIFRSNPVTLLRETLTFSPAKVIAGQANLALQDRDIVRILGFAEVRRILAVSSDDLLYRLLQDSSAEILGGFVAPGRYPVAGEITLSQAFAAAGGFLPGADLGHVEVTRFPTNNQSGRQETHRTLLDLRTVAPTSVTLSAGELDPRGDHGLRQGAWTDRNRWRGPPARHVRDRARRKAERHPATRRRPADDGLPDRRRVHPGERAAFRERRRRADDARIPAGDPRTARRTHAGGTAAARRFWPAAGGDHLEPAAAPEQCGSSRPHGRRGESDRPQVAP